MDIRGRGIATPKVTQCIGQKPTETKPAAMTKLLASFISGVPNFMDSMTSRKLSVTSMEDLKRPPDWQSSYRIKLHSCYGLPHVLSCPHRGHCLSSSDRLHLSRLFLAKSEHRQGFARLRGHRCLFDRSFLFVVVPNAAAAAVSCASKCQPNHQLTPQIELKHRLPHQHDVSPAYVPDVISAASKTRTQSKLPAKLQN